MQNLMLIFFLFSKMNTQQIIDIVMNSDSDMSEINDSDSSVLSDYIESDSDSTRTSGSIGGGDSDEDDENGVHFPSSSQLPGRRQVRRRRRDYIWQVANRQPPLFTFGGMQGPTAKAAVNDENNPYDYFKLFFTDRFLETLVIETNRYASQYLTRTTLTPHARAHKWTPVTTEELERFLGLVLLTGIIDKKGRIADYWRTKPPLQTPFFNQTMSRDRFQLISSFLHFNNNDAMPSECTDKLYKIRPILETLVEKWQEVYAVGEHIAIDEGILKWRGRLSFRVYNKDKPTKYGIKAYILADSASGYCWNMDIYHCERKPIKETVMGLLTNKCLGLWHSLYMDNWYNSVELSEFLLTAQVHTVGTLRKNRGSPPEINNPQNMARHDVIARDNGHVMVLAWKDRRIVKAISTKHDNSVISITRRKKEEEVRWKRWKSQWRFVITMSICLVSIM